MNITNNFSDTGLTLAQIAYGLLWRSPSTDHYVFTARQWLLDGLSKDERYEAIAWAIKEYGAMRTADVISADIRMGIFPEKGHAPKQKPPASS